MLDRVQELGVAQLLHEQRADGAQFLAHAVQLGEQHLEPPGVDARPRAERRQLVHLPLEFLQHLAADVAALRDRQDLEQGGDGRPRRPRVGQGVVVHGLLVQEIEAQEVAHPLVERLLVGNDAGRRIR